LWEKNVDAAWQEAQQGDCRPDLWLELAAQRQADHPEDALAVYRSFVEPVLARKNNDAYEEAIDLVRKMRGILKRLGRNEEWNQYLEHLRSDYRRLRNFMSMLARVS